MSKCLNQMTMEEIVKQNFSKYYERKVEENGKFEPEYERCGDALVMSGVYLDEEEADRLVKETKDELSEIPNMSQFVIEYLAENDDFLNKLVEMVKGEW